MTTKEALAKLSRRERGYGVVIAESKDGHANVGADGDMFEMLNAVTHLIDGMARNTDNTYKDIVKACNEIRLIGFEDFCNKYRSNGKKPVYSNGLQIGEYDDSAEQNAREYAKSLETTLNKAMSEIRHLNFENSALKSTITALKQNAENVEKAHDRQIQALQKEIKAEQHRNYVQLIIQGFTPDRLREIAEDMENGSDNNV